jgi:hypothetical protein
MEVASLRVEIGVAAKVTGTNTNLEIPITEVGGIRTSHDQTPIEELILAMPAPRVLLTKKPTKERVPRQMCQVIQPTL